MLKEVILIDIRIGRMIITKPGGNASKNSKTYRVNIPTAWAKEMAITEKERLIKISFDGKKIVVEKFKEE